MIVVSHSGKARGEFFRCVELRAQVTMGVHSRNNGAISTKWQQQNFRSEVNAAHTRAFVYILSLEQKPHLITLVDPFGGPSVSSEKASPDSTVKFLMAQVTSQ